MSDVSEDVPPTATAFWRRHDAKLVLAGTGILAVGLIAGGYLLGDGLTRAREADRSVSVRGLAERDVMADLATWTISYSSSAGDMASAQAGVDRDTAAIRAFFKELGFPDDALQPTGVNVSSYSQDGYVTFTVRQRMTLRTTDIARAQRAVRRQFDLVRRGVLLEEGSGMSYAFTKLNAIKPEMIAAATKDARAAAQQFANDSDTDVGGIKYASQGYFEITSRDGDDGGGWGSADTPYKRVRVVTTIDFYLR